MYKIVHLEQDNLPEKTYTSYFYRKNYSHVYEVVTDGKSCCPAIMDEFDIPRQLKSDSSIPKYILKKLKEN